MVLLSFSSACRLQRLRKSQLLRSCVDTHLCFIESQKTGIVESRIHEHGYGTEYHYRGHSHSGLVCLRFHHRFSPEDSSCTADGVAGRRKQGKILIHLQEFSEPYTEKNGYDHYDQVYCYGGESYLNNTLESQTEAVKDDSEPEDLLGAELDARDPGLWECS